MHGLDRQEARTRSERELQSGKLSPFLDGPSEETIRTAEQRLAFAAALCTIRRCWCSTNDGWDFDQRSIRLVKAMLRSQCPTAG